MIITYIYLTLRESNRMNQMINMIKIKDISFKMSDKPDMEQISIFKSYLKKELLAEKSEYKSLHFLLTGGLGLSIDDPDENDFVQDLSKFVDDYSIESIEEWHNLFDILSTLIYNRGIHGNNSIYHQNMTFFP